MSIPKNWAVLPLTEVTRHHSGNSKLIKGKLYDSPAAGRWPGFSASGQDIWLDGWEHEGSAVVVSAVGARCGKAFLATGNWSAVANTHVVWPSEDAISPKFLWFRLNDEKFWVRSGTAQPFVKASATLDQNFGLPPLPEQHRIVEAIESYFTRLDDAVATLERVQRNLKRYRASVLKAAVEGRLVPTEAELARAEGRDYEPASVLLERILAERRRCWEEAGCRGKYEEPAAPDTSGLPTLPEGWCWASVDQIADETLIGLVRARSEQTDGPPGFPYVKMDSIGTDGSLRLDDLAHVSASDDEVARFSLRDGDLLFNTRNSVELVGKTALVRGAAPGTLFNNNIMRIRPSASLASPFLAYQMCSRMFQDQISEVKRATTSVAAVYAKDLLPRALALPPGAEQERIIQKLDLLLSDEVAVTATAATSERHIARLRQSILKWAFEGKLADQDPNDEPASVLLERIKAEREASGPTKTNGRVGRKKTRAA